MLKRWFGSWFSSPVIKSSFTNYIAVIIGASNPIGEAIAVQCVTDECINVAIVDLEQNKNSLFSLQNKLKSESQFENIKIESFCIQNFKDMHKINKLVSNIKATFNTNCIQFLFNNIDCLISPLDNNNIPTILTQNSSKNNHKFQQMMDFNFWSVLYLTRSFLPLLMSKENIQTNKKCFIVNTSSLKSTCLPDSSYSISKYCVHALCEIMKYEIDVLLDNINTDMFDLKLKILCPGFVENNDAYNLVNISHKYDELGLGSTENLKKVINKIEITVKEFGKIIFDGIRDENMFVIESHPNIFRVFATDKLISMTQPKEKKHTFTKRFLKSTISKL